MARNGGHRRQIATKDSATSGIQSRELLYHSWRNRSIACHFCNIRQEKIAQLLAREPVCCACKGVRLVLVWPFAAGAVFVW